MRNLPLAMGSLATLVLGGALFVTVVVGTDAAGTNADAFLIDMDPGTIAAPTNMLPESGGQCGNSTDDDGDQVADDGCDPWDQGGAGPLGMGFGAVEDCARINENNIVDADEESADTAIINVVADNIPSDHPMFAFAFTLNYDATKIRVASKGMTTGHMINAFPGSSGFDAGESMPDTDGAFSASVADTTADVPSSEYGDGSLGRLALQSLAGATGAAVIPLTLTGAVHQEYPSGANHPPDALIGATLSLNLACGATPPPPAVNGDVDCSRGEQPVSAVDALKVLRHVANSNLPVDQNEPCDNIGTGGPPVQGDVDCSDGEEPVSVTDALMILRYVAGLSVTQQPGCAMIGT